METIYLYVKKCSHCGLLYFGMTIRNPFIYSGSGTKWVSHLKKYDAKAQTINVWGFDNRELARDFALKYSKDHNIVKDRQWANLTEETVIGEYHTTYIKTPEHRKNLSIAVRKAYARGVYKGIKRRSPRWTEEMRKARSEEYKGGCKISAETRARQIASNAKRADALKVVVSCLECGTEHRHPKHLKRKFCDRSCAAKFNNRARLKDLV